MNPNISQHHRILCLKASFKCLPSSTQIPVLSEWQYAGKVKADINNTAYTDCFPHCTKGSIFLCFMLLQQTLAVKMSKAETELISVHDLFWDSQLKSLAQGKVHAAFKGVSNMTHPGFVWTIDITVSTLSGEGPTLHKMGEASVLISSSWKFMKHT